MAGNQHEEKECQQQNGDEGHTFAQIDFLAAVIRDVTYHCQAREQRDAPRKPANVRAGYFKVEHYPDQTGNQCCSRRTREALKETLIHDPDVGIEAG